MTATRSLHRTCSHVIATGAVASLVSLACGAPPTYLIVELEPVAFDALPMAINDHGVIVGESFGSCLAVWHPVDGGWLVEDPIAECVCQCVVIPSAIGLCRDTDDHR